MAFYPGPLRSGPRHFEGRVTDSGAQLKCRFDYGWSKALFALLASSSPGLRGLTASAQGHFPFGTKDKHDDHTRIVCAVVEFMEGAVLNKEVALLGRDRVYLAVFSRVGDFHFALEHDCEIDGVGPVHRTAVLA